MGKCILLVKVGYKICFTTYGYKSFWSKLPMEVVLLLVKVGYMICFTTFRLQKFLVKASNGSCVVVGQSRLHDLFYYILVTKVFWSKLPMEVVLLLVKVGYNICFTTFRLQKFLVKDSRVNFVET